MRTVHATTAMFPGVPLLDAVERLHTTVLSEPLLGTINTAHVQLCPQNRTQITESIADQLCERYPNTQFRLHANAHVLSQRVIIDASNTTFDAFNYVYFRQLAIISKRLGAPAYSLHAGYEENSSLVKMLDNVNRIQDLFGDIPVAVEGLYPGGTKRQLMRNQTQYEYAYLHGAHIALDLSHIKIIKQKSGFDDELLRCALESPQTIEVHLSDNNGRSDEHTPLTNAPYWWNVLNTAALNSSTVIFTEGNQRKM